MRKILNLFAVTVLAAVALTGCIYVPAEAPTSPPEPTQTVETPVETPTEEPTEEPTETPMETPVETAPTTGEDRYLEQIRTDLPEANGYSDAELLQMAQDSCVIAEEYGFEEGVYLLIEELQRQGGTQDDAYLVGYIYGAAVANLCPEHIR